MPHQCTACGRGFADGSKQMLSGCPDCGGSTFQFLPDGGRVVSEPSDGGVAGSSGGGAVGSSGGGVAGSSDGGVAGSSDGTAAAGGASSGDGGRGPVGRVATTIGDWVAAAGSADEGSEAGAEGSSGTDSEGPVPDREAVLVDDSGAENDAQAAARGSLPGADRLLGEPGGGETDGDETETDGDETDHHASARASTVDTAGPAANGGPVGTDGPVAEGAVADVDGVRTAADGGGAVAGAADGETERGADPDARGEADANAGADVQTGSDTADVEVDPETVTDALDSQFESIRIVAPGQYELNLWELFDREEHVIAVRENGRYVIDVAEARLDGE